MISAQNKHSPRDIRLVRAYQARLPNAACELEALFNQLVACVYPEQFGVPSRRQA